MNDNDKKAEDLSDEDLVKNLELPEWKNGLVTYTFEVGNRTVELEIDVDIKLKNGGDLNSKFSFVVKTLCIFVFVEKSFLKTFLLSTTTYFSSCADFRKEINSFICGSLMSTIFFISCI